MPFVFSWEWSSQWKRYERKGLTFGVLYCNRWRDPFESYVWIWVMLGPGFLLLKFDRVWKSRMLEKFDRVWRKSRMLEKTRL